MPARSAVHRDEGEVTSWPRSLVAYVPAGAEEEPPSPHEDRLRNRLILAARLLALLRASGEPVDDELGRLRAAERAVAADDRARAKEEVERLLGDLAARPPRRADATR